jgi:hypothetical protein
LYGVVDIQGIKLIGSLSANTANTTPGTKVRMVECGIRENGCLFYHFDPA